MSKKNTKKSPVVKSPKKVVNKVVKSAKPPKNTRKQPKEAKSKKNDPVESPVTAPKEPFRPIPRFVGRPVKYKSVAELEALIDAYFLSCWTQKLDMFGNPIFLKDAKKKKTDIPVMVQNKPYTITGLAIAIGTTRDTLIDYENGKQESIPKALKGQFSDTIKKAKELCKGFAEEQLFIGRNPTGAIFNLKNNFGFKDKTETEHSGNLTWVEEPPK